MATKRARIGNAGLYIGLPWAQRKSLPRDSRGFEPLDQYFPSRDDSPDDDTSDTDTEELIQEEKQRRMAERRQALAVPEQQEEEGAPGNMAESYSPQASTAASPEELPDKMMPSRLTFDSESDTDPGARRPATKRKSVRLAATSHDAASTADLDPLSVFDPPPANGDDQSTVQSSATEVSFHPKKTSTQVPGQKRKSTTKLRTKKIKLSTISALESDSESEEEDDTVLQSLMAGSEFPGLAKLTQKRLSSADKNPKMPVTDEQLTTETEASTAVKRKLAFSTTASSSQSQLDTASQKHISKKKPTKKIAKNSKQPAISTDEEEVEPSKRITGKSVEQPAEATEHTEWSVPDEDVRSKVKSPAKTKRKNTRKTAQNDDRNASDPPPVETQTQVKRKNVRKVIRDDDHSDSSAAEPQPQAKRKYVRKAPQKEKQPVAKNSPSAETQPRPKRKYTRKAAQSASDSTPVETRPQGKRKSVRIPLNEEEPSDSSPADTRPPAKRKYVRKAAEKGDSSASASNDTPSGASSVSWEVTSAGTNPAAAAPKKTRKRRQRITIKPRRRLSKLEPSGDLPQEPRQLEAPSPHEGLEITTTPGGRRYRRLRLEAAKSHTPGVRRSHRTKIAPVKFWDGEQVEYDTRRKSGVVMTGVLVPVDKPKAAARRPVAVKEKMIQEECPPLPITDRMGNTVELNIVWSLSSADQVNNFGAAAGGGDEVCISKLYSSPQTSNGVITLSALGNKERCRTKNYEMFFYMLKGSAVFKVNDTEFTLLPETEIHVPAGAVYTITNPKRTPTTIFYYTNMLSAQ